MKRTNKRNVSQVLGGLIFAVVLLVGLLFFAGFWRVGSSYTVSAYVYNARGIAQDSTVFEAGLPVGLVTGTRRQGPDAILSLRIDAGVRPLPVDSTIQLGLRSLAGEADVLLTPGHSEQLVRNGGSLGLSQDQDYTEVDQILNELAGSTEGKARTFFQGVGASVDGQGYNLNQTVGGFARLVNVSLPVTSTIAHQNQQVADIVQNVANIMNAIGQRTTAIDEFAHGATDTFEAMAAQDETLRGFEIHLPKTIGIPGTLTFPYGQGPALEGLLKQLTPLFKGGDNVLTAVGNSAPATTTLVDNLTSAVQRLKPSIEQLTPAATSGIKLLGALGDATPALKNMLAAVEQTMPSATKAFPALHALTCQVDPMARFISPYAKDLPLIFQSMGAADSAYEQNAFHELVAALDVDPSSFVRGVETQPDINSLLTTLFNFGLFKKVGGVSGIHAIVPPGTVGGTSDGLGDETVAQFGADHPYPHVTADCTK